MTSSWPWMQGVESAMAATPIDPVDAYDDRPAVQALIAQHRTKLDAIAQGLQDDPLFDPLTKHDDLWILRFYLSHKKTERAIQAAKTTLQFRKDRRFDEKDIRKIAPQAMKDPNHPMTRFHSFCKPGGFMTFACLTKSSRGVVAFMDAGCVETKRMVQELEPSFWLDLYSYLAEWSFQWCDYMTRTTGRLTKTVRFLDFGTFSIAGVNFENARLTFAALNAMEDCYPQLLDKYFLTNAPMWMQTPWNLIRPVLPKRMVAKMDFVRPSKNAKHRARLYKYISQKNLPRNFGGDEETPLDEIGHEY